MKKYISLIALVILSFSGISQTLVPEATWIDGNHRDWCDKGLGTTFLSYNGVLYAFNYQGNGIRKGGHAYMYTINAGNKTTQDDLDDVKMEDYKVGPDADHNNKLVFGYPGEGSSYDEGPVLGRTFTFQFEGRAWYYEHIRSEYYKSDHDNNPVNESYKCYAQLPTDDSYKCYTYYRTVSPVSQHMEQGAFQLDSLMYFLVWREDSKHWTIDEHYYSSGDKQFHSNGNDFVFNPYIACVNLNLSNFKYFGGLVRRLDSLNNEYFVATFYAPGNFYVFGKIVPGVTDGKRSFTWEEILAEPDPPVTTPNVPGTRAFPFYIGATTLAEGSMKGNRTESQIANKEQSDRLVLFGESNTKSSDGYYHVAYCEYYFENDLLVKDAAGELVLPSSRGPNTVGGNFFLYGSYQLKPMDYTTMLPGTDGYQSYMWLLYPDHDRNFNGAMFLSDSWKQDPALFEESTDLDQDTVYEGIRDLWSLMGIIDGSPPVSMNWETWEEYWGFPVPASSLEFETDSSGTSEFKTDTEHEWSVGESIEVSAKGRLRQLSAGEKFKYSQTYGNTVSNSQTNGFTYSLPFDLEEQSQEYGFYIYSVPQIRRYSYMAYPWWDNNTLQYPVESSFQYLFVTIANTPVPYPVKLDEYPFYVEEPNDPSMDGWDLYDGRSFLYQQVQNYGLVPVMRLDWTNLSGGSSMNIQTSLEDRTSNSQSKSWDFEVEAGIGSTKKIPHICKIESKLTIGAGYSGTLSSETTTTTEYGHRISASLEHLHFTTSGINLNSLHLWAFLFTPETNPNWWYFDSLDGQKPFYLAWVVSSATKSLELQSPGNGSRLEQENLFFTWVPDHGELYDYELLVSKSSNISYYNAIYRKQMGKATALSVPDFQPEPGETYYWSVKAYDENGEVVYSPVWSFTIADPTEEKQEEASLKALVYPNPSISSDITIAIDPAGKGKILVRLIDINDALVVAKEVNATTGSASIVSFPDLHLPAGIYLAVIRSDNEQVVKKVVVR
jgi:hypothetical protein